MSTNELPDEVTNAALAKLLNVSDRRVRQMLAVGLAVSAGRGRLALGPSVRRIIDDARQSRDGEVLSAARARAAVAKAAALELETKRRTGELIFLSDHDSIIDALAGAFLVAVSGLPARIAGNDPVLRRRVETACDAMRGELAKRMGELAEACGDTEGQEDV